MIPAHGLTGQKARVQLMVALGATADPAGVRAIFGAYD
jgi:L-asparaginase/Glu-tRNA(Gln) amidotransferase subunit D